MKKKTTFKEYKIRSKEGQTDLKNDLLKFFENNTIDVNITFHGNICSITMKKDDLVVCKLGNMYDEIVDIIKEYHTNSEKEESMRLLTKYLAEMTQFEINQQIMQDLETEIHDAIVQELEAELYNEILKRLEE